MTRDELHQEFMEDETQYCCYCGSERGRKFGCCGENHWQTYAQMDLVDQEEFLDWEEENAKRTNQMAKRHRGGSDHDHQQDERCLYLPRTSI